MPGQIRAPGSNPVTSGRGRVSKVIAAMISAPNTAGSRAGMKIGSHASARMAPMTNGTAASAPMAAQANGKVAATDSARRLGNNAISRPPNHSPMAIASHRAAIAGKHRAILA